MIRQRVFSHSELGRGEQERGKGGESLHRIVVMHDR